MTAAVVARAGRARRWAGEASGAVADLGVLLPIALTLVVVNGLSVTAVLVPAGLTYLAVAVVFRVPVAVQPLKAFGAAAIATGAGVNAIAAGAVLLGAVVALLAATGGLGWLAKIVPAAVIRGVQGSVGLLFLGIAWRLVWSPPAAFVFHMPPAGGILLGLLVLAYLAWRRGSAALVVVAISGAVAAVLAVFAAGGLTGGAWGDLLGPTPLEIPRPGLATFALAAVVLVLPQVPLTLTNACLAPPAAAQRYFGSAARRVTARGLGLSLGAANLAIGAIGGMPVCHGAGGMSAHHAFGARTWRAPALIGSALVGAGLAAAGLFAAVVPWFPVPALAALLAAAGLAHLRLLSGLRGRREWLVASLVGLLGFAGHLLVGVIAGVVAHRLLVARHPAGAEELVSW